MSTLAINSDNDIYFDSSSRLVLIEGSNTDEEILQKIKIRLRFFKEEWFLNTDHGIPYFQDILGSKNLDNNILESIFRKAILDVEGVKAMIESSVDFDPVERKVSYYFNALSVNNTTVTDEIIENLTII